MRRRKRWRKSRRRRARKRIGRRTRRRRRRRRRKEKEEKKEEEEASSASRCHLFPQLNLNSVESLASVTKRQQTTMKTLLFIYLCIYLAVWSVDPLFFLSLFGIHRRKKKKWGWKVIPHLPVCAGKNTVCVCVSTTSSPRCLVYDVSSTTSRPRYLSRCLIHDVFHNISSMTSRSRCIPRCLVHNVFHNISSMTSRSRCLPRYLVHDVSFTISSTISCP